MLTIGGLLAHGQRDEIARELAALGTIAWFEQADALVAQAMMGDLDAVIVELLDDAGHSIAPVLVALAATRSTLPIIIRDQVNSGTLGPLLAVCAAGLQMEFAVRPYEPLVPLLSRMRGETYRPGVAPVLLQHFMPHTPPSLRVFVALAAITTPARRSVRELAGWSGVSARTIERRLLGAHWPPARVILQSFNALDAVWLMSEYGWPAQLVVKARAFPHASGVTRLLRHYCGMLPSTLRESGGFAMALQHVKRTILSKTPS